MVESKACVVALIGKSQLLNNQTKAWKLNTLLQKDYFKSSRFSGKSDRKKYGKEGNSEDDFKKINIETYHDVKNRVIYIHLESIYDTSNILDKLLKSKDEDEAQNFFELWEKENTRFVKSMLLLFSISHIIIVSSPCCEFDIGYIRFFRIVDTLRNKMLPTIVDQLKSLNLPISKDWIYAGRPCSPRVLFTFENCEEDITNTGSIEKLQHSLEDQIYNSLRKSYVITNISNNSLFAIPANQEFVYIHRLACSKIDTNRFLLAVLHKECSKSNGLGNSSNQRQFINSQFNGNQSQFLADSTVTNESQDSIMFRKFVFDHIKTALADGFNDNIGRTNVYPVFELAKPYHWDKVFDCLHDLFLGEPKTNKIQSQYNQLKTQIDIDAQFSENRCKKQLPTALNLYQEGLPSHYTKSQHNQRLDKAIQYFNSNGRGPMFNKYLKQLTKECENIWQTGRQLCEAISLNGHPCVYELHRVPAEQDSKANSESKEETEISEIEEELSQNENSEDASNYESDSKYYGKKSRSRSIRSDSKRRDNSQKMRMDRHPSNGSRSRYDAKKPLAVKVHSSNIITIAASNCGEFQRERIDPFDLKEANFTFYEDFSSMVASAKKKQIKHEFETFKPSSANFKADEANQLEPTILTTQPFLYSDSTSLNLSQEEQFPKLSKQSNANPNQARQNQSRSSKTDTDSLFPSPLINENKLIAKQQAKNLYTDIVVTTTPTDETNLQSSIANNNQQSISPIRSSNLMDSLKISTLASTEVYLVGLLSSESKPGLLPRFSSWSLISIGKSTGYSPQTGLNQPGFLPNHNFLIPWDIVISKGAISSGDTNKISKRNANFKKNSKQASESGSLWSADQASGQSAPVTVRAYIGMEYECPYGHRFICSGPDRIVKVSTNGNVKDDAYKLLNGDMPLYTACPCRNSKDTTPYMAQMMRVYIVTPSSTVNQSEINIDYKGSLLSSSPTSSLGRNFTSQNAKQQQQQQQQQPTKASHLQIGLKPRVQPNPMPCPIFWPSDQSSIDLIENSIWVLRLPYIYMGDSEKPYYRPKDFETLNNCRVLKGMFSVTLSTNTSDIN